jgi:hypothetical protein
MPAQKFVHYVSPELTQDAQFKSISEIPAAMLTPGTTVMLYPGTYDPVSGVTGTNLSFKGVGDKDEVIVNGFTFANTIAGTITFENMTINGPNQIPTTVSHCITVQGTGFSDSANVTVRHCTLANANVGVMNNMNGPVVIEYCDLSQVDKAVRANGAMTFKFSDVRCASNSNAYADSNNATIRAVTIKSLMILGGGSNGAATTKVAANSASTHSAAL